MKQLRKILFASCVFTACLFISPAFIKADLTCKSTLKKGSSGVEVKELQTILNEIMSCNLTVDGKFGSGTEKCVKKYQEKKGLSIDGKVGPSTCSKVNADYMNAKKEEEKPNKPDVSLTCSSTLKRGSNGTEVKNLQTILNEIMSCNLTVDGKFGSGTEICVKKYQEKKGLSIDGKVGPSTCAKVNVDYIAGNKIEDEPVEDKPVEDTPVVEENTSEIYLNCRKIMKQGSSGTNVKDLQKMLNKVVNCNLKVDGKFGSGTATCVKKYQAEKGLSADGSVGISTCSKLNVDYASDHDYIVVNAKLNVRKTPSTEYDKIGTIERGTVYKVYETVQKSSQYPWYKIKYNDGYGYIYGEYVDKNAIVVDISDQILHMYKKGKLVLEAPVITGRVSEGWGTRLGKFLMKPTAVDKVEGKYLTSTKYGYKSWVDFWMRFDGGIGFHDAEYHAADAYHGPNAPKEILLKGHGWRSVSDFYNVDTYKTNGSHGCVNMLHDHAKTLYNLFDSNIYVYVVE